MPGHFCLWLTHGSNGACAVWLHYIALKAVDVISLFYTIQNSIYYYLLTVFVTNELDTVS